MITVTKSFLADFKLVAEHFGLTGAELEEAKTVARGNMPAAEDSIYASAAMIRAGWIPMAEHAQAFLDRTGFKPPAGAFA